MLPSSPANTLVVFDFETTGMSPDSGDRSIEVGAVKLVDGVVVAQFSQLMNPGIGIPLFIQNLTGISNAMVRSAPKNQQVMAEFFAFVEGFNLVAHNAAFDAKFLHAEFKRIKKSFAGGIGCSLLAARRVLTGAPSYKLGELIEHFKLPRAAQYHRALADAEACAHVWLKVLSSLEEDHGVTGLSFGHLQALSQKPKQQVQRLIKSWCEA
ncbi:MAG TPA: exonuclease domain-containing protein [Cellvibrionaceae bacterium]|nr:exonuclease domain-containing protein [Cellvibrionaceae bacterium]